MILVKINHDWYRTRALYYRSLNQDIRDLSQVVYDSKKDIWYKCEEPNIKTQFKLDIWMNGIDQYEFINTSKIVNQYYLHF